MFKIKMSGGLGNQLFCYAFYLRMQQQFPTEQIEIDYSNYKYCKFHNGLRLAQVFDIKYPFIIKDYYSLLERVLYKVRTLLRDRTYKQKKVQIVHENVEEFENFLETPLKKSLVLFNGGWESELYFKPAKELVLKEFSRYKMNMSDSVLEIADRIQSENSVFMHVRRGDYLKSDFVDLSSTNYYKNALTYLKNNQSQTLHIYVISDEPDYCKTHFDFLNGLNVTYIAGNQDYEDLFLMSKCKYAIIANSSFSWWGAYLSKAYIVCAPKARLKSKEDRPYDVLYPKEWKIIS